MKLYIINQKKRWPMTQEELDALMEGGLEGLDDGEDSVNEEK